MKRRQRMEAAAVIDESHNRRSGVPYPCTRTIARISTIKQDAQLSLLHDGDKLQPERRQRRNLTK
jgi:hypothetical protein